MKSHDCRVDLLLVALLSLLRVVVVLLVLSSAACVGCHHLSLQAGDGGVLFEKHVKQLLVLAVVDATCRGYLDIEE